MFNNQILFKYNTLFLIKKQLFLAIDGIAGFDSIDENNMVLEFLPQKAEFVREKVS